MEARILILGELVIGQRSLWECSGAKGTLVWGLSAGLDSKVESGNKVGRKKSFTAVEGCTVFIQLSMQYA